MGRWLVGSAAVHVIAGLLLYSTAIHWVPKEIDRLVPRIGVRFVEERGEPGTAPSPEAPEVSTPKAEPTRALTPVPEPTRKPAEKVTPKATRKAPRPEPTKRVSDTQKKKLLEILARRDKKSTPVKARTRPIQAPDPSPTRETTAPTPPARRKTGEKGVVGLSAGAFEGLRYNYYLDLMNWALYDNWEVPPRGPDQPIRTALVTVTIQRSGEIMRDIKWERRSGSTAFDESIGESVRCTELPPLPTEFKGPRVEVTITFEEEG